MLRRLRWAEHLSLVVETRNVYQILVGASLRNLLFGPSRRLKGGTELNLVSVEHALELAEDHVNSRL
jgi:hypothetical protein